MHKFFVLGFAAAGLLASSTAQAQTSTTPSTQDEARFIESALVFIDNAGMTEFSASISSDPRLTNSMVEMGYITCDGLKAGATPQEITETFLSGAPQESEVRSLHIIYIDSVVTSAPQHLCPDMNEPEP